MDDKIIVTINEPQEVFNIPKERDRVLVRECELTPQKAVEVCQILLQYLADSGMVPTTGTSVPNEGT